MLCEARPTGLEPATTGSTVSPCELDVNPDGQTDLGKENGPFSSRVYAQGCASIKGEGAKALQETAPDDEELCRLLAVLKEHWPTIPAALRPMIRAQIMAMVEAVPHD